MMRRRRRRWPLSTEGESVERVRGRSRMASEDEKCARGKIGTRERVSKQTGRNALSLCLSACAWDLSLPDKIPRCPLDHSLSRVTAIPAVSLFDPASPPLTLNLKPHSNIISPMPDTSGLRKNSPTFVPPIGGGGEVRMHLLEKHPSRLYVMPE